MEFAVVAVNRLEVVPRRGRFCTGAERSPEGSGALRLGSFADGSEQIRRR
jgi:hypothetical protein